MTNQELQSLKNKYDIIGNDPALNRALEIAVKVAPIDMTVLVTGESGVGKENIPKIIHQNSPRRRAKYFAINCGAIPEGTVDSELFGHEKGAFTGANEMRKGYFEEADGGTLFLDEVAELPLASQAKLLRVLQDGEFIRVGSSKVLKTDVRVIAATNVNLLNAVAKGKFRADLYYRLETVTISMPALRERPADINLLFRKFASDFSSKYGICKVTLTEDASILLRKYRWPGNIRQLKNVAEKVSALESVKLSSGSDKCVIDVDTLMKYIPREEPNLLPTTVQTQEKLEASEKEAIVRMLLKLKHEVDYMKEVLANAGLTGTPSAPVAALPHEPSGIGREDIGYDNMQEDPEEQEFEEKTEEAMSLKSLGQELIEKVLRKHGGNRKAAAAELGISERTLYRKLKK
ncbi:MAG: sigma-54-dependent Fis family transcriptional regulator [Bacteroidales bacterium]|nr:sigma-54-dependent Fis family transcriptional regulator [Bacteroidales bacterium]